MADGILPAKTCRKCSTSNFYPSGTCKTCSQEYAKKHREKIKAYQDQYRVAHLDDKAAYRKANVEKIKAYSKKYREANREILSAKFLAWHSNNPEKMRACVKAWRDKNWEKYINLGRVWRRANRERLNSEKRADYARNSEKFKKWADAWRASHPDKYKNTQKLSNRKWRQANPEKVNALARAWRLRNPEKSRLIVQNRRDRKNGGKLSPGIEQKLYRLQNGKCACCGKHLASKYHLDHIVPLALGGPHSDSNMQLLTPACNMRKSAKHPVDYMRSRGFLL